jgi:hypothetical protein
MIISKNNINTLSNYLEIYIGNKINNKQFSCTNNNYTKLLELYKKDSICYNKKIYYYKNLIYTIYNNKHETSNIKHISTSYINNLVILNNKTEIQSNSSFPCSNNYKLVQCYNTTEIQISDYIKLLFFDNTIKLEIIKSQDFNQWNNTFIKLNNLLDEIIQYTHNL